MIRTVHNANVLGKKVLLRVDYNLPVDKGGDPTGDARIKATVPTLKWLIEHKVGQIIIVTHWGRPERVTEKWRLKPIACTLAKILKAEGLVKSDKVLTKDFKTSSPVLNKRYYIGRTVTMLENLRFDKAEEAGDDKFARLLAREADLYVNEAFAACHRAHASIVGLPKYLSSYAGSLLADEILHLKPLIAKQERPFVAIIGGAKVKDKIPIINTLRHKADTILVGGKTANDYFAAMTEPVEKLVFPVDGVDAKGRIIPFTKENVTNNPPFDIGPDTIVRFKSILKQAQTVFWNGSLGMAEDKKFCHGSYEIARFVANMRAMTVASGGDTGQVIDAINLRKSFKFVSTGGGAASEFLAGKKLPGIEALEKNVSSKRKITK